MPTNPPTLHPSAPLPTSPLPIHPLSHHPQSLRHTSQHRSSSLTTTLSLCHHHTLSLCHHSCGLTLHSQPCFIPQSVPVPGSSSCPYTDTHPGTRPFQRPGSCRLLPSNLPPGLTCFPEGNIFSARGFHSVETPNLLEQAHDFLLDSLAQYQWKPLPPPSSKSTARSDQTPSPYTPTNTAHPSGEAQLWTWPCPAHVLKLGWRV